MFRKREKAFRRLPGAARFLPPQAGLRATIPDQTLRPAARAAGSRAGPPAAAKRRPAFPVASLLATVVLAVPLLVLGAAPAEAACEKSKRISRRDSECLNAWWDNSDGIGSNFFHVQNMCSDYGSVVAKIDLKGAMDRTWTVNGEGWRHGNSLHRVREISCCSDKSTLCNRSDVVTEAGCLARFLERSPAAASCIDATAAPPISVGNYNCTVIARCPRHSIYGLGPVDYRQTRITVDYLELDEVNNCAGTLRRGSCRSGRAAGHAVSMSVADARAYERPGASLNFMVTLDGAAPAAVTVTVDYATSDGTASAGRDYTATAGTLTFARGETARTVSLPVLDDGHDEGAETLTLRLSNVSGARIGDGEATGTIENADPMPQAWLARFGRTVTGHVLDAVAARLAAPRESGLQAALAGRVLSPRSGAGAGFGDRGAIDAPEFPLSAAEGTGAAGTSFALTGGSSESGGFAALWSRGAVGGFDGRDRALALDGAVTSGVFGADWTTARWTAGLAIGHSRGAGGYGTGDCEGETCGGRVEATLTGLYPYAGVTLTDRMSAWAAMGYGTGGLELKPEGGAAVSTDLAMTMGAAGLRGEVLRPTPEGGLSLSVKADTRFTRISSAAATDPEGGRLAAADADVWLVRTGLEGARRFALGGAATLTPRFALGLRLDGGDAETGFGAELGGGLALAAAKRGLTLDLDLRTLIAHEASGFREWGASAGLSWDPRPSTERGLAVSFGQSWGVSSSGGMETLLRRETLAGLAGDYGRFEAAGRLEGEIGYGIAMFDGGFTGTPYVGFGLSDSARDYRFGGRLTPARRGDPGFAIDLGATRREAAFGGPEYGVALTGAMRW